MRVFANTYQADVKQDKKCVPLCVEILAMFWKTEKFFTYLAVGVNKVLVSVAVSDKERGVGGGVTVELVHRQLPPYQIQGCQFSVIFWFFCFCFFFPRYFRPDPFYFLLFHLSLSELFLSFCVHFL